MEELKELLKHSVDGQQRLTTCIILINEIVNLVKENNPDKDISSIIINSTISDDPMFNLKKLLKMYV